MVDLLYLRYLWRSWRCLFRYKKESARRYQLWEKALETQLSGYVAPKFEKVHWYKTLQTSGAPFWQRGQSSEDDAYDD